MTNISGEATLNFGQRATIHALATGLLSTFSVSLVNKRLYTSGQIEYNNGITEWINLKWLWMGAESNEL
jgi:hypothetical protein